MTKLIDVAEMVVSWLRAEGHELESKYLAAVIDQEYKELRETADQLKGSGWSEGWLARSQYQPGVLASNPYRKFPCPGEGQFPSANGPFFEESKEPND